MDFEIRAFCAKNLEEKIHKRWVSNQPTRPSSGRPLPEALPGRGLSAARLLASPCPPRLESCPQHRCLQRPPLAGLAPSPALADCLLRPLPPRNSVRLVIRKVQYAPEKSGPQPMAETTRHFLMSDRSLHLEASLDKEVREALSCARPAARETLAKAGGGGNHPAQRGKCFAPGWKVNLPFRELNRKRRGFGRLLQLLRFGNRKEGRLCF